ARDDRLGARGAVRPVATGPLQPAGDVPAALEPEPGADRGRVRRQGLRRPEEGAGRAGDRDPAPAAGALRRAAPQPRPPGEPAAPRRRAGRADRPGDAAAGQAGGGARIKNGTEPPRRQGAEDEERGAKSEERSGLSLRLGVLAVQFVFGE